MRNNPIKVEKPFIISTLKENAASSFIGLVFIILSLTLFFIFLSNEDDTPQVNYELINQEGIEVVAQITDIETQYNTKINGIHPIIVSYKYLDKGHEVNFKFKTLSERKAQLLKIGEEIPIKKLNGNSIIKDLKPFNATYLKYISLLLLLFGLPFLFYPFYKTLQKS